VSPKAPGLHDWNLAADALEQAFDAVVITNAIVDPPGPVIIYVNRAFEVLTGYAAAEVLGNTPRMLQGPRTERKVLDTLREAISRGERWSGQAVNYRKDGSAFLLEWRIAPVLDRNGRLTNFISFQRDAGAA
jgi:PAS domain S-box-containing protein